MKKSIGQQVQKKTPDLEFIDLSLPTPVVVSYYIAQALAWYLTIPVAPPQQPPVAPPPPPDGMAGLTRAQMKNALHGWINCDCPLGPVTVYV